MPSSPSLATLKKNAETAGDAYSKAHDAYYNERIRLTKEWRKVFYKRKKAGDATDKIRKEIIEESKADYDKLENKRQKSREKWNKYVEAKSALHKREGKKDMYTTFK